MAKLLSRYLVGICFNCLIA